MYLCKTCGKTIESPEKTVDRCNKCWDSWLSAWQAYNDAIWEISDRNPNLKGGFEGARKIYHSIPGHLERPDLR